MVLGGIEGRGVILQEEGERSGVFLARRAPTMKRIGMTPTLVLCSRNRGGDGA